MGTHPIFESDFDCLTELRKMFRLSKGNQSRKNHKIINQTTKVSDTDTKLSTPAIQAQQHQLEKQIEDTKTCVEEVQKMTINSEENEITKQIITEAINQNVEKVPHDPMVTAMSDMENYIRKMGEYMNYMKELEEKNARLEYENLRYRAENESLKGQLINVTPQFPIQEKIRMQMTNNHQ